MRSVGMAGLAGVARPSSRGAVDDMLTHHISNPTFRFGVSGRGSTSGRNSSLGFSHPTDHMYEEPSAKANSRGSTKRKVVCIDGMCVDGQYIVPFEAQGDSRGMHGVEINAATHLDPLSALSSELEEIHSKPIQPAPKRRIVATNFCSGAQSKLEDTVNPFKRRSLPDSGNGFRLHTPVARLPESSQMSTTPPSRQKATQFCERCGGSSVQPYFMSSGNECLKAEVWGTRNVDEYSTDLSACSASYKCFSCFHVTNC